MRIAFVAVKNVLRGGGIEKYTLELGARLVARGHDVTVYSMRHYGATDATCRGMKIVGVASIPRPSMEKLSASIAACLHMRKENRFDVVHMQSVAAGACAMLAKPSARVCVLQMHGLEWQRSRWGWLGRQALKGLERLSISQCDAVSAVSMVQCSYIARKFGAASTCIPTGTEVKPVMPPQEILKAGLEPQRYVLFASRTVSEKGAHYLIPAFRALKTGCKLAIAGDARGEGRYKRGLRRLAQGDPRILFLGQVEGRLLEELFAHATLFVQPSEIEGLSISILDAMSYGCRCLVSDIPENLEAIGTTGSSFRSRDIEDLTRKLGLLLQDHTWTQEAAERSVQHVRMHHSWDKIAEQFEHFYSAALDMAR